MIYRKNIFSICSNLVVAKLTDLANRLLIIINFKLSMDEHKISNLLPELAKNFPEKVQELAKYEKENLRVSEECSLQDVIVKDLLESKLLR